MSGYIANFKNIVTESLRNTKVLKMIQQIGVATKGKTSESFR